MHNSEFMDCTLYSVLRADNHSKFIRAIEHESISFFFVTKGYWRTLKMLIGPERQSGRSWRPSGVRMSSKSSSV